MKRSFYLSLLATTLPLLSAWCNNGDVFTAPTAEGVQMTFKVLDESGKLCQVGNNSDCAIPSDWWGEITIPSSVEGYTVSTIGMAAFWKCNFVKMTIPESVDGIKEGAFSDCKALKELVIEDSEKPINMTCSKYKEPEGTFQSTALEEVYIGRTVSYTSNGYHDSPFVKISSLKKVVFGGSNNIMVCRSAFADCSNLQEVQFTCVGMALISKEAFYRCSSLKKILLPATIIEIQEFAFSGCSSLTEVVFPSTLETIGDYAFQSCAFSFIELPSALKTIGRGAFSRCINLESIDLHAVEAIHDEAFNGTQIREMNLPSTLKTMGSTILSWWNNLNIPASVTSCGRQSVSNEINVAYDNPVYDSRDNCNALIESATNTLLFGSSMCTGIPNTIEHIGDSAFLGKSSIKAIVIPSSVRSIGKAAFCKCDKVQSLSLNEGLESIGPSAFCRIGSDCWNPDTSLRRVVLPHSLKRLDDGAFDLCPSIHELVVGNNVEVVGYMGTLKNLQLVVLGRAVKSIGKIAVGADYTSIPFKTIVINASTAPKFDKGNYQFASYTMNDYKKSVEHVIVPNAALDSYLNSDWNSVASVITYEGEPQIVKAEVLDAGATSVLARYEYYPLDSIYDYGSICKNVDTLRVCGMNPSKGAIERIAWQDNFGSSGTVPVSTDIVRPELIITVQPAQAISNTRAIIAATTNGEDDALRFGFEWRRYDAPDLVPSNIVNCPVFDGALAGTLNNLSANTYYKYRPFYKSDSGNTYYGEWIAFGTADAYVYFEPIVHTIAASHITSNSATVSGSVVGGSDDITEQGFEYWPEGSNANSRHRIMAMTSENHLTVTASGTLMTAVLSELLPATFYHYRSYAMTAKGVTYGEENTFATEEGVTGDVNGDGTVDVADISSIISIMAS